MTISLKPTSVPAKRLSESIDSTSMTLKVTDILGWDGAALTSASFGSKLYASLRNVGGTQLELIEIDPTTIASTSITILQRGLSFSGDYTTPVTANKLTWIKGDTIVQFGTDTPQMFQTFADYIDAIAIAGAPNASTTLQGLVELSTQAELRARTATGGTGAKLAVTPDIMPNVLISDYIADTGIADTYAIAPSPAITAYVAGQVFFFKAATANTTTSTLNVNSLGAKTIKKTDGATNLAANDIRVGQLIIVQYDGTNFQMLSPVGNAGGGPLSSDYSDGTVTISVNTSLTRDMYYDTLTVNNGVTLSPSGFRIFARSVVNNGTISNDGGAGGAGSGTTGGTAGAASLAGSMPGGFAGKSGGAGSAGATGTAGTAGSNSTFNLNSNAGAAGGAGGTGTNPTGLGGASGAGGTNTSTLTNFPRNVVDAFNLFTFTSATAVQRYNVNSGSGSGGGGGWGNPGTGGGGGGSGGSGGIIFIAAKTIANTGTISAKGGNGGNGANVVSSDGGGGGGGGGGNGGIVFLLYGSLSNSATISAAGGTGGTKGTNGPGATGGNADGANGSTGLVIQITQ